jgi:tripartite-type tricarboxylate transporter receptor subunit TctC
MTGDAMTGEVEPVITRRRLAGYFAASALAPSVLARSAFAQALPQIWPNRPLRMVCPVAAGGGIDAVTRLVAARLSEIWRQQVVVENRTGGGGNIAAEAAARSEPDGYTILAAPPSLAVASFLSASLSYDPAADFAPVSLVGTYPNIMVVPVSSPAHSVVEFIAYAKANRGKISYASGGHGSSLHLAGELFQRMTGIEMTHVPYRGAAPAFNDLIPGRVDVMFNLRASSLPLIKAGRSAAGFADGRGSRRSRVRCLLLDRPVRAGENAAADRGQDPGRYRRRAGRSRDQAQAGGHGRGGGGLDPGGARGAVQGRHGEMGTGHQGRRDQHA